MPISKQLICAVVLIGLGLLGFKFVPEAGAYIAFMGALGGVTVLVLSGASSEAYSGLQAVVRRAREGEATIAPPGAPVDVVRMHEELNAWAEASRRSAAQDATQRRELAQLAQKLSERVERLQKELGSETHTLRDLSQAGKDASHHVEALSESLERAASAAKDLERASDDVSVSVKELGVSVDRATINVDEMNVSIKEIARNVDGLARAAEDTSSSMNEMDVSIGQVQSNATETARLSEEVAFDAEKGAEAILKTISEIGRIKESSLEAMSVIASLGSRIDAIGQIVNVIDDVAEQTNLLALNAAIIAAQAGEQGKGFAVVADEIKDLADRAGSSTRDITELIKTIQNESRNAIVAVERGAGTIDRGVQISNEAERALKKILESSQKSTTMMRSIARTTVEQAKGSRQVTDAIGRIAETAQNLAKATTQQVRSGEVMLRGSEKIRATAEKVDRSAQAQTARTKALEGAVKSSTEVAHRLREAQRGGAESARQLTNLSSERNEQALAHLASIKELTVSVEKLKNAG